MRQEPQGMMETAQQIVSTASSYVWGWPLLILLGASGIYFTIILRGIQFWSLGPALYLALIKRREEGAEGDISHYQALMTALAATVGTGNIAGVATAIAAGGPGALFWMWMTALFGMATKFGEAVLGVRYRVVDANGEMSGGPAYYLSRGIGGGVGRFLAAMFAAMAAIAAFGIGNMVQSNSVADALRTSFGINPTWTGLVIAIAAGAVILGGIKSIGRFTGFFVPIMIVFYLVAALYVLIVNFRGIPAIFTYVLQDAFSPAAPVGGFLGASVMMAIRMGVARGIFSNESGLGTGGIAAAAAQTNEPVSQAMVSMTQTFIDTIVVCSLTGFAIIATGVWQTGTSGAPLTILAFNTALPGAFGGTVIALGLVFFAFSTILGWAYYGERQMEYLFGIRAVLPYRLVFIVASFFGAYVLTFEGANGFQLVWDFADVMNGLMAFPNLIGMLMLSGVIAKETRDYFNRTRHPAIPEEATATREV